MSGLQTSLQNCLNDATCSRRRFATVPGTTVRLLTQTTKMPGPSWSLPAHRACPRANGTICDSCYAEKGCYRYSSTQNAQKARFKWTVKSMRSSAGREQWIAAMVEGIHKSGCAFFRVHDSGDMFSVSYAEAWLEVCRVLPEVKFWIPTRTWQMPQSVLPMSDPLLMVLSQMARLPNVTVRPSALNFRDHAPRVAGLHAGSTAEMPDVFRAWQCPAPKQDGMCSDCRVCWDSKDMPVSYCKH
jgi:hypothetical protein